MNYDENGLHLHMGSIDADLLEDKKIYTLMMPKQVVAAFQQSTRIRRYEKKQRTFDLRNRLVMEHPDVFFVELKSFYAYPAYLEDSLPFLYTEKQLDLEDVLFTIEKWSNDLEIDLGIDPLDGWEWVERSVSDVYQTDEKYSFLAAYYHYQFSKTSKNVEGVNFEQPITFRLVMYQSGETSCVSEPVRIFHSNKRNPSYSSPVLYEIQAKVVTKPFSDKVYLKINTNLKRIVEAPIHKSLQWGKRGSILVYGTGLYNHSRVRTGMELKVKNDKGKLKLDLSDMKMMERFLGHSAWEDRLTNRETSPEDPFSFYPIFNNHYYLSHHVNVGAGLDLKQRWNLTVAFLTENGCAPLETLSKEVKVQMRNKSSFPVVSGPVDIDVWDNEEKKVFHQIPHGFSGWGKLDVLKEGFSTADDALERILQKKEGKGCLLELSNVDAYDDLIAVLPSVWKELQLELLIAFHSSEKVKRVCVFEKQSLLELRFWFKDRIHMVEPLAGKGSEEERFKANEVRRIIQQTEHHDKAIVHIPGYHLSPATASLDSKKAVGDGFRQERVLVQFINSLDISKKEDPFKIPACVRDLLQHAGYLPQCIYDKLPLSEVWVGVKLLKVNNKRYLVVSRKKGVTETAYKVMGKDAWLNYRDMSKFLITETMKNKKQSNSMKEWWNNKLEDALVQMDLEEGSNVKNIYVVMDASLRSTAGIKYLTNGAISSNEGLPECFSPRYTLIRYNDTEEVAEGTKVSVNKISMGSGLFRHGSTPIFSSVGVKTATMPRLNWQFSKETGGKVTINRQVVREILVAGEQKDEETIAKKVHQLRNGTVSYKSETNEPLPLRSITLLGDYVNAR
ncbi:DUF3962 domain-containing protein [Bacillus sp. SB49]|uniref:pPIWI_RE module domain-containing protein n=1 Tax=Bacillus sp. SB49 TaxID=1071080 RepID=UPI000428C452|nr:DUF3962 domain-containing protein [Bacillus sp. SB49]QHT47984.1 DUF3962 domain-containing protein [Bacillus sp. SB49]